MLLSARALRKIDEKSDLIGGVAAARLLSGQDRGARGMEEHAVWRSDFACRRQAGRMLLMALHLTS